MTDQETIKTIPMTCTWQSGIAMLTQVCLNHKKGSGGELMEQAMKMGEQVDGICEHYTEVYDALNEAIELLEDLSPCLSIGHPKIKEFLAKHNEED